MDHGQTNPIDQPTTPRDEQQLAELFEANPVYERFGEWLDEELRKLESRWIHRAAPNAERLLRAMRRF